MNDHNEEAENQINLLDNEEVNSDNDDGTEAEYTDDKNSIDKLDSELVDSDVNVEATELTSSDVDLSDESDMKGDLTSDAESNEDRREIDESAIDSDDDEETFALEVKDTKDDSSDEKDDCEDVILENPEKNTSGKENDDNDSGNVEKSMRNANSDGTDESSDELRESKDLENKDQSPSQTVIREDKKNEIEASEVDASANGKSPIVTERKEQDADTSNVDESSALSKSESNFRDDTDENNDISSQREDYISDDALNFIGFDSETTDRTTQILYILQQNYQELLSQLQSATVKDGDESTMEVDIEQTSQSFDAVSEPPAPIKTETAVEELSQEKETDEQMAAIKRVKKKRKFFDEFDENEMDPPKKPKEQRDDASQNDTSMSENKENFMNSEKPPLNDESTLIVSETPLTVAPSTPNPSTRAETKAKFDITNPDFKEPFKYGWRREVVYRFISEDGQKKSADVSYFTPQGKKLRSIKQINENLPKDGSLHIKNFTFSKELIFRNRESDLEVTRFTKKMEAELLTNESPDVSSDHIIDRRLGIEPISVSTPSTALTASPSGGDDSAKKAPATSTTIPASSTKKKEPHKSKANAKTTPSSLGSETTSKSKPSFKKGVKNMDTDADETTNATPKLTMPKIMLRGPNVANSNVTGSKVTSSGKPSGMKIKINQLSSKHSSQKTVKKASSSLKSASKNSKSLKRIDKSNATNLEPGTGPTTDGKIADRSSHSNINGASPIELVTHQSTGHRAPVEFYSSFTLSNISRIYDPLLMSLKYLTVRDLLRVSMTSKFLNRIASEPCLWKTVRLKNSQVHDWKGFAKALQKYGTKRLDMRKMLCSTASEDLNKMWEEFLAVVPSITSLEHIDFSRSPMNVVDAVAGTCPNLAIFNALYLKNGSLTLDNFTRLEHLVELRLKGVGGIDLKRNDPQLHFINKDNLREISLTCIKNIDMDLLKMISEARNLVTLELGDCAMLPPDFAHEIGKLRKLEKLRLEKLDNLAPNYELLNIINSMEALKSLELINVEIKDGFDQVLSQCKNVENFLIIPLYLSQSATTNQLVLDGIKGLSDTLKCFVWCLTTELLKVTDLFMDQWQPKNSSGGGGSNSSSNKKSGDSIPVRKLVDKPSPDGDVPPTQVDILPIYKLERILTTQLPKSRVKVVKVPYQMTWRQSLSECLK